MRPVIAARQEEGVDGYVILRSAATPARARRPTSRAMAHPESVGMLLPGGPASIEYAWLTWQPFTSVAVIVKL